MDKFVTKITTTIESPSYSSIPGGMQVTSSSPSYSTIPISLLKVTFESISRFCKELSFSYARFLDYPAIDFVELPPLLKMQRIQILKINPENTLQLLITETLFHMFGLTINPFWVSSCSSIYFWTLCHVHLQLNMDSPPHRLTPVDVLTLPDLPPNFTIHRNQLSQNMIKAASSYTQDSPPTFAVLELNSARMLMEVYEIQLVYSRNFGSSIGKNSSGRPVWDIGPFLPISSNEMNVERRFLNSIAVDQMMELAKGLERSEQRFIWVLRNPSGFEVGDKFRSEWLPYGFEERMKQKGQGFLSNGVLVIGGLLGSEQYYNSKLLEEELGVCLEFEQGFDAIINSEDVVRLVLEGDKGVKMRKKAEDLSLEMKKALMKNGSSVQSLDNFVKTLRMWGEEGI
ncbi:hypothetical protein MKW92_001052 [Papaver armeniacum]|nr:hypothetical protein MKW92_001052 [Papaver armeniacum]